jgi:hypothetical protein
VAGLEQMLTMVTHARHLGQNLELQINQVWEELQVVEMDCEILDYCYCLSAVA